MTLELTSRMVDEGDELYAVQENGVDVLGLIRRHNGRRFHRIDIIAWDDVGHAFDVGSLTIDPE